LVSGADFETGSRNLRSEGEEGVAPYGKPNERGGVTKGNKSK
jgi:hypothetical protein